MQQCKTYLVCINSYRLHSTSKHISGRNYLASCYVAELFFILIEHGSFLQLTLGVDLFGVSAGHIGFSCT